MFHDRMKLTEKEARALVAIALLSYILFWSYVTTAQFFAMNSAIWDLGYSVQVLNGIIFHATFTNLLTEFSQQGISLILSPLTFLDSIPAILILQNIVLGLPAYVIFEIANDKIENKLISTGIAIIYLLYFPLAGISWFDFHFEAFFIFLFLTGYLFLIKKHNKLAGIFLLLSGFVRFPYMILVTTAMFSIALPNIIESVKYRNFRILRECYIIYYILIASVIILVLQYILSISINPGLITIHNSANHNIFYNLKDKLLGIFFLNLPLLFLPLFSKKWILPQLPFYALVFVANNFAYEYPYMFSYWYTDMVIPFLFLGLIDTLQNIRNLDRFSSRYAWKKYITHLVHILKLSTKRVFLMLVIFTLVTVVYLQPYGPLNSSSFNNFNLWADIKENSTVYRTANEIVNLIPKNQPYILAQNSFVQLFPRPAVKNILVSPYNIGPNVTMSDILDNKFPFDGGSEYGFLPINYVLIDLSNLHTLTEPPTSPGYPTMIQMAQMLYSSGKYGILAASNGIYLLKRDYMGQPVIEGEYYQKINLPSGIFLSSVSGNEYTSALTLTSITVGPGTYVFMTNITLKGSSRGIINEMFSYTSLNVTNKTSVLIPVKTFVNKTSQIYVTTTFNNFSDSVSLEYEFLNYNGTIKISSISLTQFNPPL